MHHYDNTVIDKRPSLPIVIAQGVTPLRDPPHADDGQEALVVGSQPERISKVLQDNTL